MLNPASNAVTNERRKGPDWLCLIVKWIALSAWFVFVLALLISHYASPDLDTGIVRYWDVDIREYWHPRLTIWLVYLLWLSIILSLLSLTVNRLRMSRVTDHLYINVLLLLATSTGLLWYVLRQ